MRQVAAQTQSLPHRLEWEIEPESWRFDGKNLDVVAGGSTDNFVDPAGTVVVLNGARAVANAPSGRWQLSAQVRVDFRDDYDAGVLMVWLDDRNFAKLCFERSPQGEPMVVSVVTRGVSDDANAWVVGADTVWLRISNIADDVYAFHASNDGQRWDLVRYFSLSGDILKKYGISVQSPVGEGCAVTFTNMAFTETQLTNLRDGS